MLEYVKSGRSIAALARDGARKALMLALFGAALVAMPAAQAQSYPVSLTVDFENMPVGPLSGRVEQEQGIDVWGFGQVKHNASNGNYFESDSDYSGQLILSQTSRDRNVKYADVVSLDVAIAAPAQVNGQDAKSYMVVIWGNSFRPVGREIVLPAPGADGLSFVHLDNLSLGGDMGPPYGQVHPSDTFILGAACAKLGCSEYADGHVYRICEGLYCGDADYLRYAPVKIAVDNVKMTLVRVAEVPEPSTYAMLLLGLAGVGFAARRRA